MPGVAMVTNTEARQMMRADEDRVDVQRQRQRQHGVHRAWRECDDDVGEPHMGGQQDHRDKDRGNDDAMANDPSAALTCRAGS